MKTACFARFFDLKYIVACGKHFSEKAIIDAGQAAPAISALSGLSRFCTLDMALDEAGRAFVVETGDGQVSECPGESASDLISALSML